MRRGYSGVWVGVVALLLSAFAADPARAAYNGPWDYTWDFNGGAQNWVLQGGASWTNTVGGGSLWLPDASSALLLAPVNLGGQAGGRRFAFQADVRIDTSDYLRDSGIAVVKAFDNRGPQVAGGYPADRGVGAIDRAWTLTYYSANTSLAGPTNDSANGTFSPYWATLQIDYGFSTPGKWSASVMTPFTSHLAPAGTWHTITSNVDCLPTLAELNILRLGAVPSPTFGGGLTQAKYDNVRLAITPVPEPTLLGAPLLLVGCLIFRRRRRANCLQGSMRVTAR